jgi:hypothetical protein
MASARVGKTRQRAALSLFVGDAPPTEFRIFAAGKNSTSTKGEYLFDDTAAREVMAAYEAHGADVMIDLEHLSVADPDRSVNFDPDARGWCKLEIRNGELWATDVTWTPDGLARLAEKRQRYVSPCFAFDTATRRVTEILNIAITAMPATDNLDPLVAASRRVQRLAYEDGGDQKMTPEQFAAIAEALGLGADSNIEDVLATIAAMVKKVQDAANGSGPAEEPAAPADGTPEAAAAVAPPVVAAARVQTAARALARLTGKKDIGAAIVDVEAWRTAYVELEAGKAKLAKETAALESGERRRLVGELVKCGAEIPGTAWEDDAGTAPAEPWKSMPMDQLRTRVAKLTKAKGVTAAAPPKPHANVATTDGKGGKSFVVNGETVELSARELQTCEEMKAKPEDYAANKLIRTRAQAAQG